MYLLALVFFSYGIVAGTDAALESAYAIVAENSLIYAFYI